MKAERKPQKPPREFLITLLQDPETGDATVLSKIALVPDVSGDVPRGMFNIDLDVASVKHTVEPLRFPEEASVTALCFALNFGRPDKPFRPRAVKPGTFQDPDTGEVVVVERQNQ